MQRLKAGDIVDFSEDAGKISIKLQDGTRLNVKKSLLGDDAIERITQLKTEVSKIKIEPEMIPTYDKQKILNNIEQSRKAREASNFKEYVQKEKKLIEGGSKVVEDSINGIKVIDGKISGKIQINKYNELRDLSIHNKSSASITLGKYRPTINADGTENWKIPGPDSYNTLAKNDGNMYFDMGSAYDDAMKKDELSYQEMFDYFNVPALDDAANTDKIIRFSHNAELPAYKGSFTELEWKYLQDKYDYLYLREEGGFWYGEK